MFTDLTIILGCVTVALIGFATSFDAVSAKMRGDFGPLAPLVPIGVDVGILISSAAYISLARRGEGHPALRIVPHALTAATIYLNVAAGHTLEGRIAHGVMVALWAIAVEVSAHVAKSRLGLDTGTRFDPVPVRRWLLDPVRTALLWRRMSLWNVTEYRRALAYERARRYAIGLCKARHGRYAWRWNASPLLRMELTTGDLPDQVTATIDRIVDRGHNTGWKAAVHTWIDTAYQADTDTTGIDPATDATRADAATSVPSRGLAVAHTGKPATTRGRRTGMRTGTSQTRHEPGAVGRPPVRTDEELLPLARRCDDQHRNSRGRGISGDALAAELRVSKGRALELLRRVRAEGDEHINVAAS